MPPLGPISRRELIAGLRSLGFEGPFAGTRHAVMRHSDGRSVRIPNPHSGDVDYTLVRRLLRQVGIDPEVWKTL